MRWLPLYQDNVSDAKASGDSGWWNGFCPFHEDPLSSKSKSFGFNAESGGFKCQGCGASGNAFEFFAKVSGLVPGFDPMNPDHRTLIRTAISDKYPMMLNGSQRTAPKVEEVAADLPTPSDLQRWHEHLLGDAALVYELASRGITERELKLHMVGYSVERKRYAIPINAHGQLVNVRFWASAGQPKFQGVKGRNQNRIFPDGVFGEEIVWLVEGEPDCLMLRSIGLNAATFTSGATATPPENDLPAFKDKGVIVCYDIDEAGRSGAKKVASALRKFTRRIKVLNLLEVDNAVEEGDDLTDIYRKIGFSLSDKLKQLASSTEVDKPKVDNRAMVNEVGFADSIKSSYLHRLVRFLAIISGHSERPYSAFSKLRASCYSMSADDKKCTFCPLVSGSKEIEEVSHQDLLRQIRINDGILKKRLSHLVGACCDKWIPDESKSEHCSLYEVMIGPGDETVLDRVSNAGGQQRRVYMKSDVWPKINQTYTLTGMTVVDPNDQSNTQVFTESEEAIRPTDQFILTDAIKVNIRKFNP